MNPQEKTEATSEVSIFLFGKPAWEIELEGADVDAGMADTFETLGKELNERLRWIAEVTRKLLRNEWEGSGGLYDIYFYKPIPVERAKAELTHLGVNPDDVNLEEVEPEDCGE
jgi:hypothetical protein